MDRKCLACDKIFLGRVDKKYCSDECRFSANNLKRRDNQENRLIATINSGLRKNRSILKRLSPEGKTTVRMEYLLLQGFDFRYHTHQYLTKKGNVYNFCYEYGYLLLPEEKVLIVNWQSYMG
jgi:hypothetical protein